MRNCRSIPAAPLAYLFNLDNGYFPDSWKMTRITIRDRKDSKEAYRLVDATYFDYRKAFDDVNDILLSKLASIGFTPKILKDRLQYVECKDV
ncbi:unnamed protein product [Pieris macdunnoughi]|uniref:Uncharacterized protein n=1 Tax=Pieris macdunnoughi TaxID=345717 RepID=A0A821VCQ7_9NEOP|nr:unnamed protein product [Pieris macdunnoughi]